MNNIITQKELVARFEAAFNRIHVKLKELSTGSSDHISYSEALYKSRTRHNVVRHHYQLLKQFGHLRNALVHQRYDKDHYIAVPHEDTVKEIEKVERLLMTPPLALSIASQPVVCFNPETPIRAILQEVERSGFSQFPIYDETTFVGLLTEGGIARWMSKNITSDLISIEDIQARDILLCEKPHNVSFLGREKTIYDLEDVFEEAFDNNDKLEAVLITQSGKRSQKPIGIVTSWDLVQIDQTILSIVSQV
jgi:predicted transcriptional regulator